jgi:serine/threonine protein kinase
MSNKIQSCLSSQVLEQIVRNEVSPDDLLDIEEHVSECPHCREMFDSHYNSSQWSELIQPALSESQLAVTSVADDGADHSSAILKLLGPTDDPNMLGRIGNYEIVGVIGQGGMGAVFKGFDRSLNRFVAIKMLLPHLAASGAARKRFAREGQAVAAVVDDHVMAIHCVDQWQGIPYLVMTYSRGISLQKRLNDSGPLEVREILRIGMQAAKGLAAAHAQGIVHRDIKPSNILLDQNVERVQLVDFGLARAVDDASLTCSGTLAGTPQYMSPEQARAEAVDHRSDLFSLGSVLYAMCAGYAPFRADSSYSVLRLIIEKEPRPIREINSDIPEWLCAIIGKLMAKHAIDRFDSAKQVAELLEACLAHVQQPTTVPLPPSVARLSPIEIPSSPTGQTQLVPNGENKETAWKRFVGPHIGKYIAAAAAAAAFLLGGVVIVLELNKGTLTIKSVADNVPIRILQGKDTVQELTVSKQGTTIRLRAGTYTVEIEGDSTAYEIRGDNVTVKRGEVTLVDISVGHAKVVAALPDNSIEMDKPQVDVSKAKTASNVVDVDLLLANLEFSNKRDSRGYNTDRSVRWARILMDLTNVGSVAVPKIIERLDQTEDDRMIASLAFVLRAIGDKRGVPLSFGRYQKAFCPRNAIGFHGLNLLKAKWTCFSENTGLSAKATPS